MSGAQASKRREIVLRQRVQDGHDFESKPAIEMRFEMVRGLLH
jgi:hypothetical protein